MQDLFKYLPAVVYEYAIYPDGRQCFTYVSEASSTILGIDAQVLLNDASILDTIVHEDDLPSLKDTAIQSRQSFAEWHWQGRVIVNGRVRWMEFRSNHEVQKDGRVLQRGIIQNISERKQTEIESELQYQSLIEKLPVGIVIHNKGKLVFANAYAYSILGIKEGNLIGKDVIDMVHPDFRERVMERMKEAQTGIPVPLMEQKYLHADGRVLDLEVMAYSFTYKGAQCVQVIFRDITEKKQTEARIKKNETLFTQLFQNVPMAVVMLDENGKVFQVNKGFEKMFGFALTELRGKNLNDFIVPEELRNEGIDLNNLITSNQVVSIETIRRHRSGDLVNVILCGVPVMLDNQTIGIYGVYVDITDRKSVEEELKIRNTELDNFVYKVSHDLRAPLSSILGLVNLARLPGNSDDPLEYIDIIGNKVQALDHFINDVLSHSKNLKMEVSISKVDLRKIIDQTFTDLSYLEGARIMKRNIKIEGIEFYSDHWRISEIFRNLISNAIKYRQLYTDTPEINIKIHVDHLRADINFSDNGIGIDEVSLSKIFDMFYRATEQSDGSGIGLYIVKNAIDKLGGQINVVSKVGHGTRFNILLPNRINSIINKTSPIVVEPR
ncbi:PAS domain-containing sensor histidine kinase [Chryseosolibacter indicus]|uniref:histidine kinase n=1 Tax=Chryseosolibacter indicus TaxID=2782351 RepID=A0ABS5VMH6_9BACT|nr:PAS domain-containing sensor histidine kinase [Chryseosolibacter indicus]MBT1702657.1 PAS domain S-box protein [Chryseosolibacter indicus]